MLIQQALSRILDLLEQELGPIKGCQRIDNGFSGLTNNEFNAPLFWNTIQSFSSTSGEMINSKPATEDTGKHLEAMTKCIISLAQNMLSKCIPPIPLEQLAGIVLMELTLMYFQLTMVSELIGTSDFTVIHLSSGDTMPDTCSCGNSTSGIGLDGDELRNRLREMPTNKFGRG
ncbi:hypothetical protein KKF61_01480 [Patescibacteria group bacterium]|nr:hypothetical protein [Patescibacteria group bacterium]MBU0964185.1 hypothetical protein [Patescibacteria group bacterium]